MKTPSAFLAAALAVAALAGATQPALARSYRTGAIEVTDPWTRPAPAGAVGVGYMSLANTGKTAVSLVSATTPAAKTITLHKSSVVGGVARMSAVAGGISIPPGGSAVLGPGGYHMMLEGLAKPLSAGERAPMTLKFSNGQSVQVELAVQLQPGAAAGGGMESMPGMAGMTH